MPAFCICATTAATINGGGCGIEIAQKPPSPLPTVGGSGEIDTNGTFCSPATAAIATDPGSPDVPINMSTLSSSTSLRALRVDADGSPPSSSWTSLILWPSIVSRYAIAAAMPLE